MIPASPCPKCGAPRAPVFRGDRSSGKVRKFRFVCRACNAQRLRDHRASNQGWSTKKNRKWGDQNPEKRRAHKRVEYALKTGRLIRQPCERCGTERAQAHHDDYSRPLEVTWLCQAHHRQRHRELEAQQNAAA